MAVYLQEWLGLALRWLHLTTGIAWIGASFYFNWLENNLRRLSDDQSKIAGSLWAVHGGGFYYLEKYRHTPPKVPPTLHWFKWEAYFTWVSGFALLVNTYYFNASAMLIQNGKIVQSPALAVGISLLSLFLGWQVYDHLCKFFLQKKHAPKIFIACGLLFFLGFSYLLLQLFDDRAAYLHVGMIIGTIMVANVFDVIIPSQKALVESLHSGKKVDPSTGSFALMRSRHNNYLTLPVLFVMISSHYPMTYGHASKWLTLISICFIGVAIRHFFNQRHLRMRKHLVQVSVWVLAIGLVMGLGRYLMKPPTTSEDMPLAKADIGFTKVSAIFANRCVSCHSERPTDDVFTFAPQGVMFDTPKQIKQLVEKIKLRAVDSDNMPLANKTQMSAEERQLLGKWIAAGAPID